jgi:hypothetical protein
MPTTKTISQIGDTKLEVIKDKEYYDSFKFTVDDLQGTPHSPKTVMYVSSEPLEGAERAMSTTGRVSMSNATVGGIIANNSTVVTDITLGRKLLLRDANSTESDIRASIYAETNATDPNNHRLILDPYKIDDGTETVPNNGTVYIRGNLVVDGDRTVLDTAEHVTSDDYLSINAKIDENGVLTGGAATVAGIKVYHQANTTSPTFSNSLDYDFTTTSWITPNANLVTSDITAENVTATGVSTLSNVEILGGNIKNTTIGGDGTLPDDRNAGYFTTVNTTGIVTGQGGFSTSASSSFGNVTTSGTVTTSGHLTAQAGLTVSNGTTSFDAGFSAASGTVGYLVAGATTLVPGPGQVHASGGFVGNLTGDVTGTVSSIGNHSTTDLSEGTNLYYTNARAKAAISVAPDEAILQYDSATGVFSTNLSSGGLGGLGDVTLTSVAESDIFLSVIGTTTLTGALDANSTADIADTLTLSKATGTGLAVTANATVGGTTTLTGALDANSTADIADTLTLSKATGTGLAVTANATVGGTLDVTGALDANSTADIADTLTLSKATGTGLAVTANATVGGTTTLTGALDANSTADIADTLTLSKATGTGLAVTANATVGGTLDVTGTFQCSDTIHADLGITTDESLGVTKDITAGRNLSVIGTTTLTGALDANSTADIADTLTLSKATGTGLNVNSTSPANYATQTASIVAEGGVVIKSTQALDITGTSQETALVCMGGAYVADLLYANTLGAGETTFGPFTFTKRDSANNDPDYNSIIFTDNRDQVNGDTTHKIFDVAGGDDTSGNVLFKRILGDDSIEVVSRGVSARTIGNIVPVALTAADTEKFSTRTIAATATSVPLHADILNYYSGKTFAAGKCVVALTNGTHASVAMFSFSVCASVLTMVLDQEVHSSTAVLSVDYDSSGTIDLNLGSATSAIYCVKVLPIMTSDSITEQI